MPRRVSVHRTYVSMLRRHVHACTFHLPDVHVLTCRFRDWFACYEYKPNLDVVSVQSVRITKSQQLRLKAKRRTWAEIRTSESGSKIAGSKVDSILFSSIFILISLLLIYELRLQLAIIFPDLPCCSTFLRVQPISRKGCTSFVGWSVHTFRGSSIFNQWRRSRFRLL